MKQATTGPDSHPVTDMKQCIEDGERCYRVCFSMAMNHRLEQGGRHVEPNHFRLMRTFSFSRKNQQRPDVLAESGRGPFEAPRQNA